MLMHGCKEGQCASCKSFVLDGDDIELDHYSTFALPDYEKDEGFTLLCRAHAYEDVTIELLNYDEEMIRSGLPIQEAVAEVVVQRAGHARHAAPRAPAGGTDGDQVLSRPVRRHHRPGHRGDPVVLDGEHLQPGDGELEFVIKVYPDGLFSQFLDTEARGRGPARHHRARSACSRCGTAESRSDLRRRRRRDGTDPVAAAHDGRAWHPAARRPTTTGARRRRDLCFEDELRALETCCPTFRYVPALSEPTDGGRLGRRGRPDHRRRQAPRGRPDRCARICLRPAADGRGGDAAARRRWACDEKRIYYDKFTTTGDPDEPVRAIARVTCDLGR